MNSYTLRKALLPGKQFKVINPYESWENTKGETRTIKSISPRRFCIDYNNKDSIMVYDTNGAFWFMEEIRLLE